MPDIGGPAGEDRGEPLLVFDREPAEDRPPVSPRLSFRAVDLADGSRREPAPLGTIGARPVAEREPPLRSRRERRPFGPIGSLLLHLLPLLLLLGWPMPPAVEVTPIPVQLIFEPPPAPPPRPQPKPAPPKPETKPPKGRIASEDIGGSEAKGQDETRKEPAPAPKPPAAAEVLQQTALAVPPPLPAPSPKPETVEPPNEHFAPPLPKPKAPPKPTRPQRRRGQEQAMLLPRPGRFPGPSATRDEYLAYIAALTRRHLNLLPLALVGARRGETVLDVLVLDNGTVALLRVRRSSGYPDIDERIERMISAVGRFPPLPQWFQGPSMQLEFKLRFPEALAN